jgi:sugar lactone lactonase YvrE
MKLVQNVVCGLFCALFTLAASPKAAAPHRPAAGAKGTAVGTGLELVARFSGAMPTGVAVSRTGRVFVCFPRWADPVAATVVEVLTGRQVPYPQVPYPKDADRPEDLPLSVQSLEFDAQDRLWMVDNGDDKVRPRLVGVDLKTDRVFRVVTFPADVVLPTSYLNDVRVDLHRGAAGTAYLSDAGMGGPSGLVVVDLATGKSLRRLSGHPTVEAAAAFLPFVEGEPLEVRFPGKPPGRMAIGADGLALSPDGEKLYYSALSSRRLHAVGAAALADAQKSDEQVAETVEDLGEKGASDGLEVDAAGRLYVTDYEHNAVRRRTDDGEITTLARDSRLLWPDSLALSGDGYLYVTANQLHRQPLFHDGKDLRVKPYLLFRLRVPGAQPVRR